MEAIKFSELPSGDKQDLGNNDGVPIIANNENRLLSWGQLKKQLAKQTHTEEVALSDTNRDKVVTKGGLENRLAELENAMDERLDDIEATADGAKATANSALASAGAAHAEAQSASSAAAGAVTTANAAKTTADGALASANEASTTASSAKTTAEGALTQAESAATTATTAQSLATTAKTTAENAQATVASNYTELNNKITANTSTARQLRTDLDAETTARTTAVASVNTAVQSVASRVGAIETKIANGELGGGGDDNTGGGTVDLSPVNNRLTALETKDTAHENRLEALETAKTTQASKISELESAHTTINDTLETLNGTVASLQNSTNIADSEGNAVTVATAITEAKTAAATAQTTADTASTTASAAKTTAEGATTAATNAQTTANEAKATANTAKAAAVAQNFTLWQLFELAHPTADEIVTKEILEEPNVSFADSLVYFNNNFNAITSLLNQLHTSSASDKTVAITEGLTTLAVSLDETGNATGSFSYSEADATLPTTFTYEAAIKLLFIQQRQIFLLLKSLVARTNTRDQDISAVLNSITNTLNSVVA